MIVFLLQVVQSLLGGRLLLQLLYLHLVVVQLVRLRVAVLQDCLEGVLLMHGGEKSSANFYGRKPLGGADFLPLPESFFAAGFSF